MGPTASETLLSEYLARYFQEPGVSAFLLARSKSTVTYASQLRQSLSYACMYFPPSKAPARAPYAPPAPFLDSGDVLVYDRVYGSIAVGELYNPNEQHALALLRDSMRMAPRLARRPRSRKFAVDLSSPALEIIEFAWLEDNSLIIACRKLKSPPERLVSVDDAAQPSLVLTADILFYDVIPENKLPTTPLLRMTLNEKPVVCVFCGAAGFASCACSSSFKRRAPSSIVKNMTDVSPRAAGSGNASLEGERSKPLATWTSHTERIFAINQAGSFFVRWYRKNPKDSKMHLWIKPRFPISYRFVCGSKQQTIRLCALYIKHMRLCGEAYSADARLYHANMANPLPQDRRVQPAGSKRRAPDPPQQEEEDNLEYAPREILAHAELQVRTGTTLQSEPQQSTEMKNLLRINNQPNSQSERTAQTRPWFPTQRRIQTPHLLVGGASSANKFAPPPPTSMITAATMSLSPGRRGRARAEHEARQTQNPNEVQGYQQGDGLGASSSLVYTGYSHAVDSYAAQYGHGMATPELAAFGFVDSSAAHPPHALRPDGSPILGSNVGLDEAESSLNDTGGTGDNRQESTTRAARTIPMAELSRYMTLDSDGVPLCTECNTRFEKRGNLSRHVLAVHLKYKPFECDQCPAAFGYKTHMMRHIRTVHRKDKLVQCPYCDVEVKSEAHLAKHKRDEHPTGGPSSHGARTDASRRYRNTAKEASAMPKAP